MIALQAAWSGSRSIAEQRPPDVPQTTEANAAPIGTSTADRPVRGEVHRGEPGTGGSTATTRTGWGPCPASGRRRGRCGRRPRRARHRPRTEDRGGDLDLRHRIPRGPQSLIMVNGTISGMKLATTASDPLGFSLIGIHRSMGRMRTIIAGPISVWASRRSFTARRSRPSGRRSRGRPRREVRRPEQHSQGETSVIASEQSGDREAAVHHEDDERHASESDDLHREQFEGTDCGEQDLHDLVGLLLDRRGEVVAAEAAVQEAS